MDNCYTGVEPVTIEASFCLSSVQLCVTRNIWRKESGDKQPLDDPTTRPTRPPERKKLFAVTKTAMQQYEQTGLRFLLNALSIGVFSVAIYFRRHSRKDLAVILSFFNVCLFVTITVIEMTEVAAALGFGLFAILSIIRLRSEPFNNREIGYFFGALVLGLVNGVGTPDLWFTIVLNVIVVGAIFVLDHPAVLQTSQRRLVTLDCVCTDQGALREILSQRLNGSIDDVTVTAIDFVRDSMQLEVQYRPHSVAALMSLPSTSFKSVGSHEQRSAV
jgi:hypothetical protein